MSEQVFCPIPCKGYSPVSSRSSSTSVSPTGKTPLFLKELDELARDDLSGSATPVSSRSSATPVSSRRDDLSGSTTPVSSISPSTSVLLERSVLPASSISPMFSREDPEKKLFNYLTKFYIQHFITVYLELDKDSEEEQRFLEFLNMENREEFLQELRLYYSSLLADESLKKEEVLREKSMVEKAFKLKVPLCQSIKVLIKKFFELSGDFEIEEMYEDEIDESCEALVKDKSEDESEDESEDNQLGILISQNDKPLLFIKPKLNGAESGVVITDLKKKETWYVKVADSRDKMAGLVCKLQEQIILKLIGNDLATIPLLFVVTKNGEYIPDPQTWHAVDGNIVLLMTKSAFANHVHANSSQFVIPEEKKEPEKYKKIIQNFSNLAMRIIILGPVDSSLMNWIFECSEIKSETKGEKTKKVLDGGVKLVDTMSSASNGDDKRIYPSLDHISDTEICDCRSSIIPRENYGSIFERILYIFKYTQSFKGQNSESYFMPYVLNGDALYSVFTSYCQEHQDEMMSYLIKDCVIPFLDRVVNSDDLTDEEKLDCFRRFVLIDNYCGNEFTKIMAPNYYLKIKEGSTFEDLMSEIAEYIDKKDEYLERVDGVLETRKEIEFKNIWLDYIQNRKEQETETEQILLF